MNISIKGKLSKSNSIWTLVFPIMSEISADRALTCLKQAELTLRNELNNPDLKILFKIGEDCVVYIFIAHSQEIIDYLATKTSDMYSITFSSDLEL